MRMFVIVVLLLMSVDPAQGHDPFADDYPMLDKVAEAYVAGDHSKARDLLETLSSDGNTTATLIIALNKLPDSYVPLPDSVRLFAWNYDEAIELLELAAEQGSSSAMLELASVYAGAPLYDGAFDESIDVSGRTDPQRAEEWRSAYADSDPIGLLLMNGPAYLDWPSSNLLEDLDQLERRFVRAFAMKVFAERLLSIGYPDLFDLTAPRGNLYTSALVITLQSPLTLERWNTLSALSSALHTSEVLLRIENPQELTLACNVDAVQATHDAELMRRFVACHQTLLTNDLEAYVDHWHGAEANLRYGMSADRVVELESRVHRWFDDKIDWWSKS